VDDLFRLDDALTAAGGEPAEISTDRFIVEPVGRAD
jgi:hypothetical protein